MLFSLGGVTPFNLYANCDDDTRADNDSSFNDEMSKLTLESADGDYTADSYTIMSKQTGYKSQVTHSKSVQYSDSVYGTVNTGARLSRKKKQGKDRLNSKMIKLPYFLDAWRNREPRNAIGLQIWWLSGKPKVTKPVMRVSTEADAMIFNLKMPTTATDPDISYRTYLTKFDEQVLAFHPRCIARKHTVAKLCGRDVKVPEIWMKMRIDLPFKVDYALGTKEMDPIFYGARWVDYAQDGTRFLHIELVSKKTDSFQTDCHPSVDNYKTNDLSVCHEENSHDVAMEEDKESMQA